MVIGRALGNASGGGAVLVGQDTRRSGPMLEAALAAMSAHAAERAVQAAACSMLSFMDVPSCRR